MLLRAALSRCLPWWVKRSLRPVVMPWLYRLEQGRLQALLRELVRPGDLVFDVGAAEGYVTEVLLRLGARVVCVEPQPYCLEQLHRRFHGTQQVTIIGAAAGAEPGEVTLHISLGDPEISTVAIKRWQQGPYAGHHWQQQVKVAVVTLDTLIARHGRPSFCKIDVEGYELAVLRGLSSPLPGLSFELTGAHLDQAERCAEQLATLGPARFNLALGRQHRLLLEPWCSSPEQLLTAVRAHGEAGLVGDIYVRFEGLLRGCGQRKLSQPRCEI